MLAGRAQSGRAGGAISTCAGERASALRQVSMPKGAEQEERRVVDRRACAGRGLSQNGGAVRVRGERARYRVQQK